MEITPRVALEVAHHEAVVRQAYKDSVGVWTWSVGLTDATGHSVRRYIGNPQSLEFCLDIYIWALNNYADAVREAFAGHDLTEEQFAAALSFHWNTGAIKRASWVKHWKAGNIPAARKAFMNWTKPPEIKERREAERDLFFKGIWHNTGTMPEYTRVTKSGNIVWSSRVDRDVKATIEGLLSAPVPPPPDIEPIAPPAQEIPHSPWAALFAAIARIFGR